MDVSDCNKNWLEQNPFPMMATDESGYVRWFNPAFEKITGVSHNDILGASAENPPAPNLTELFGTKNHVQLIHPERGEIWLERVIKSVNDPGEPALQMHYFQPRVADNELMQENMKLKQQVESLTLTDELTGLANERSLSQHLATQVTRSRRYSNPLTLALVDVQIKEDSSHILDQHYDDAILATSHFLRERLRWADFIARCNAGRFVIVLPETTEKEASALFTDIVDDSAKIEMPDGKDASVSLRFGLAEWEKGNDPRMLVERASQSLS